MNSIVGNTPIIKINYKYKGEKNSVFVKLEYYNLTGSIKDRPAEYIIKNAKKRGELKEGLRADLVFFDDDINIKNVIIQGEILR